MINVIAKGSTVYIKLQGFDGFNQARVLRRYGANLQVFCPALRVAFWTPLADVRTGPNSILAN